MAILNASNATQLQAALVKAVGGDSILLAGGNYGTVSISGRKYAANVTIQSATSWNAAHFDGLNVAGSRNISFSGLDLGRPLQTWEPRGHTALNTVVDSGNIKIANSRFHGSLDGDPTNDGDGIHARNTTGFVLTGNTFEDLYRGSFVHRSSDTLVSNNVFKNMRVDGATFAAMSGVTIDGNTFRDYKPAPGDHADGIQFWTVNETRGSQNITIKNNVVWQGTGTGTQGIFMGDERGYGYHNVRIENNLVYSNDQYNGITVAGGNTVYMIGNTVLSSSLDSKQNWLRLENTQNILLKDNVSDNFIQLGNVKDVWASHNIFLANSPHLKTLIPNLASPKSIQDLLVDGYGYKPIAPVTSSGLGSSNVVDTAGTADATLMTSGIMAVELVPPEAAGQRLFADPVSTFDVADAGGGFERGHMSFPSSYEFFVALP